MENEKTGGKRGIILDVDGTLWDAVEVITESWNVALADEKDVTGRITTSQIEQCLGKTMFEIGDLMFGYLPVERRRQVLDKAMGFEVAWLEDHPGRLYPDVRKTLETLHRAGWRLYIVSNCQKGYIEDFLRALDAEGLIEGHICFGDTLKDKGSNIRLCTEKYGLEYAVYVGDTAGDLASSRAAGVDFIHAAYGFGEVDAKKEKVPWIRRFSDLPAALEKL